jgi:hypothetical protein
LPKEWAMTQLSRPYQIALLALSLLVVVWFVALRGHSASTSTGGGGSAPAASAPAPTAASEAKAAAAPTHVYTGPVPGLQGLTRAIARAHGAVANSQQNAKRVESESGEASHSPSTTAATGAGSNIQSVHAVAPTSATARHAATVRSQAARRAASNKSSAAAPSKSSTTGVASARGAHSRSANMQASVEAELKQGKIVAILFWNPKASVDQEAQRELRAVGHALGAKISVHEAQASQVGSFGSVTRTIQVDETPTILLVNKQGQTTTLTGLTDVFSIEQAIDEARK